MNHHHATCKNAGPTGKNININSSFYIISFHSIFKDIKSYKISHLRSTMGLVMQEPTLFNYSIQENILYGKA